MAKRTTQQSSSLLLHDEPLQILPSLAVAIGLNEAIVLQQLHYWLKRSDHHLEGRTWIYNSFVQWRAQFPFWGMNTIKRAMHRLEALGLVDATARFNRNPIDKTWWYTINYNRLNDFCSSAITQDGSSTDQDGSSTDQDGSSTDQDGSSITQNGGIDDPSWVHGQPKMGHLPEITSEITAEILNPPYSPPKGDARGIEGKVSTGTSRRPPTYPPGFLQFWEGYPHARRASKPSCLKLWQTAHLEDRTAEVCAKVEGLKHTVWQGKEPHFIPMTLTWLSQGRYEDEPITPTATPGLWAWARELEEHQHARQ